MKTYTGLIFNKLAHPKADALTLVEDTVINCCIFDFRNIPLVEQDEEDKARMIVQQIEKSLHPEYIDYTGMTLTELFDVEASKEVL